tara:strand:- start:568 stop:1620 length:1053 start_codon:yes stop_codon:yes gene_type:complete
MSWKKKIKRRNRRQKRKASEVFNSILADPMTPQRAAALEVNREAAKAHEYNATSPVTVTKPPKKKKKKYNFYTDAEKRFAVERANVLGHTAAAKELGIKPTTLYQWYRLYQRFLEGDLGSADAKTIARIHKIKDWESGTRNLPAPNPETSGFVPKLSRNRDEYLKAKDFLLGNPGSSALETAMNIVLEGRKEVKENKFDALTLSTEKETFGKQFDDFFGGEGYGETKKVEVDTEDLTVPSDGIAKTIWIDTANALPSVDGKKKEAAIDIAVANGAAEAAKRTGIPMNTISKWIEHYDRATLDELIQKRESLLREYTRLDDVIKIRQEKTKKIKKEILAKIEKLQAELAAL